MENIELTILMPCLNEAETLAVCIRKARQFLQEANVNGEILIADNGSQDGSQTIALEEGARVVDVPVRGYGAALQQGISAAAGRYIIMGDADDSYDFRQLHSFVAKLREGYELVMGNRFKGKIERGAMPFLNQYLGNPVLSLLGRIFYHSGIGDFHCGLRGFHRDAIMRLGLQATGMEFASEMIVQSSLQNIKMTEVPTTLSPDGRSRRPHLRPWRDGWRHLRLLLLWSPRWLFLYPGAFLLLIGILLLCALVAGPVTISKYTFDVHTMLFGSTFVVIGLQAIFFFVFSRILLARAEMPVVQQIKKFTLEKGLVVGLILVLLGCAGSLYSFLNWMQHDFGNLIPAHMMRILIPSFTSLLSGVQIIFASFFASLLTLQKSLLPKSLL